MHEWTFHVSDAAIGQIVVAIITIAGFGIQWARENRKRRWDIEDRAELARHTSEEAEKVRETTSGQHQEIIAAVEKGAQMSEQALTEANDINRKIAEAQEHIQNLQKQLLIATQPRQGRATDRIVIQGQVEDKAVKG